MNAENEKLTKKEAAHQSQSDLAQFRNAIFSSTILLPALEEISRHTESIYWLGAGAIAQTVWNYMTNRPCSYGINDIDIAYFDNSNLFENEEIKKEELLTDMLKEIGVRLDVKNQARVHVWYAKKFGYGISPYKSIEEAIGTWPTTATSVAIRLEENMRLEMIAPFGLTDLLSLTIRPNRRQITKKIYDTYCARWGNLWPELKMEKW